MKDLKISKTFKKYYFKQNKYIVNNLLILIFLLILIELKIYNS